jgi:hypothetical protein
MEPAEHPNKINKKYFYFWHLSPSTMPFFFLFILFFFYFVFFYFVFIYFVFFYFVLFFVNFSV